MQRMEVWPGGISEGSRESVGNVCVIDIFELRICEIEIIALLRQTMDAG